jgi:hypothetical protein
MEREQLHAAVLADINNRSTWEQRQLKWYQMRHNGLRRRSKPWPNAADLHFPLSDTIIGKLKPYYFEQLFATDTVASFTARRNQDIALTTAAGRWFDYKLKQKSNLETEVLSWIDHMLTPGRAVIKVRWDTTKKQLCFDAINPLNLIVPPHTNDIETADRIVHVIPMSVEAYRRNKNYRQDEDFIASISGDRRENKKNDTGGVEQEKIEREGITYSNDSSTIIVWEAYEKDPAGKWLITTYSPQRPDQDIRPPMAIPYDHGQPPFVDAVYEIKDKGWFSSRGIPELVAPFESSLCKLWNEKHDCMTLYNRPLFNTSREIPNAANLQFHPGQILPFDIKPIPHNPPPMSFDQEMVSTRMVAEQRVAMPDFGMGQAINTRDRKTATEINAIGEMMGNATDLRMRLFRKSLGRLYRMCWDLLIQYDSDDLLFYFEDSAVQIDKNALHGDYFIYPTGSADGVSKVYNFQKAVARMQMFNNDPFIRQDELRKSVLESDDPALVKRLLTTPQLQMARQQEDQANEISYLRIGFPAAVEPQDDDVIHIQTCLQYLEQRGQVGAQFDPLEHGRIVEHVNQHLAALDEKNPKVANQIRRELAARAKQPPQIAPAQ